jgi:hypothetical protein
MEKRSKHCDNLANAKKIPSVLPDYIPPFAGMVSRDSVPWDFKYTLITAYLPKGIRTVEPQLVLIPALKISDFNLGDRKNYVMLTPHRYLTKTTGKKPKIGPQPWIKEIVRSMILNVMKIPHFGIHQEVNVCVKILLSCYHGGYLWLDRCITMDLNANPPDHHIENARTRTSLVLPRKDIRSLLGPVHQGGIWRCGEGEVRLQGSLHPGWRSAPRFSVDSGQAR